MKDVAPCKEMKGFNLNSVFHTLMFADWCEVDGKVDKAMETIEKETDWYFNRGGDEVYEDIMTEVEYLSREETGGESRTFELCLTLQLGTGHYYLELGNYLEEEHSYAFEIKLEGVDNWKEKVLAELSKPTPNDQQVKIRYKQLAERYPDQHIEVLKKIEDMQNYLTKPLNSE